MLRMKRFVALLWIGCVILGAFFCIVQFGTDHFGPFAIAACIFGVVWHYRSALRASCCIIGAVAVSAFLMDAFVLRHRLSIELRSWSPVFDCEDIVDTLRSPSGRSTAYIVGGGFLDSAYWVYISDGGFFPKHTYINMDSTDAHYPKDFTASWTTSVFSVVGVSYDESTGQLSRSKL
jgi:hypothetical protein